jgi:hypothetical protein
MFAVAVLHSYLAAGQSLPLGIRHSREPVRSIVGNYCRLDFDGSRLSKESWDRMKSLTTWKANPDWQSFTVISQYEVAAVNEGSRTSLVAVAYSIVGRFELGVGYSTERDKESVVFRLKDVDDEWRIDDIDPPTVPHVSRTRAIAWLKAAFDTEKDPGNKIILKKALKELGANP